MVAGSSSGLNTVQQNFGGWNSPMGSLKRELKMSLSVTDLGQERGGKISEMVGFERL